MSLFLGPKKKKSNQALLCLIEPLLSFGEHFIFPLEFELFRKITPADLAEMTSQKAKFIRGIWEWFFPEAKKFMDLFCEVIWVLQFDELNGAPAKREGWVETCGVFFRELLCQPVEQVIPQDFCQSHMEHSVSGLCLGGCAYLTLHPVQEI